MKSLSTDAAGAASKTGPKRETSRISLRDRQEADLLQRAIARAKEGDPSALDFLYVRYADDVCGYVQSIVRDRFAARHAGAGDADRKDRARTTTGRRAGRK